MPKPTPDPRVLPDGAHPRDPAPHCRRLRALREPRRGHKRGPGPSEDEFAYALAMLRHPREGVRAAAAGTLAVWGDRRAYPALREILDPLGGRLLGHGRLLDAVAVCAPDGEEPWLAGRFLADPVRWVGPVAARIGRTGSWSAWREIRGRLDPAVPNNVLWLLALTGRSGAPGWRAQVARTAGEHPHRDVARQAAWWLEHGRDAAPSPFQAADDRRARR